MRSRKSIGCSLVLGALALAGLVAVPGSAAADDADAHSIVARGLGEVHRRPDSVRVDVGVEAQAPTLAEAREQVGTLATRVVAALRGLTMPELTVETQELRFNPVYSTPKEGQAPQIVGYIAMNRVLVTTKHAADADLANRASQIVDAALGAGANDVGGLDFFLADPSAAETDALALAVQNAQRDADVIAQAAHVTLTGPLWIEEASAARVPRAMTVEAAAGPSAPIEVGDIVIQSSVTAKFAFH